MTRRWMTAVALLALAAAWPAGAARAQTNFPERLVRFIVPFAAGSGTDALARIVGQRVSAVLGQQVIIENMGGANGVVAAQHVARAAPDGYTLFFTTNTTHAANQSLLKSIPYDPVADFEPVARVATAPLALFVNNDIPANDVSGLIALAKKDPGKLSFGSGSSSARLSGEMFRLLAGLDVLHVPYRSNPQALNDVVGGQISFLFADTMFCLGQAQEGKVKCMGVTSKDRSRLAPKIPSMDEAGVKGFDLSAWFAVFAPARTPKPIVEKLHRTFAEVLNEKATVERMLTTGFEPALLTPAELGEFVKTETVKWARVVKDAGIEPQ